MEGNVEDVGEEEIFLRGFQEQEEEEEEEEYRIEKMNSEQLKFESSRDGRGLEEKEEEECTQYGIGKMNSEQE